MAFLEEFIKISTYQSWLFISVIILAITLIIMLWKKTKSWSKILFLGVLFGIIIAVIFSGLNDWKAIDNEQSSNQKWQLEILYWSELISQIFYNSISILLPFILFSSIVVSILNIGLKKSSKELKKGFIRLFIVYLIGIFIAIIISFIFVYIDINSIFQTKIELSEFKNPILPLGERIVKFIPTSLNDFFQISFINNSNNDLSSGSISGIISAVIVGIIFGIVLLRLKKKNPSFIGYYYVEKGIIAFNGIVNGILKIVVKYMPIAIIGFLTKGLFEAGINQLLSGAFFIAFMFIVLFLLVFILSAMNMGFLKETKNKKGLLKQLSIPLLMGFFTQSSQIALPLTRKFLRKDLHVSSIVVDSLPTIATSGLSIACTGAFPLLVVVLIGKQIGQNIDALFYIQAIIIITILSFGMAGVPGDAAVASTNAVKTLFSSQYALSLLGVILSTDLISEMARTSVNIYGAITATIWTDYSLKRKNKLILKH